MCDFRIITKQTQVAGLGPWELNAAEFTSLTYYHVKLMLLSRDLILRATKLG